MSNTETWTDINDAQPPKPQAAGQTEEYLVTNGDRVTICRFSSSGIWDRHDVKGWRPMPDPSLSKVAIEVVQDPEVVNTITGVGMPYRAEDCPLGTKYLTTTTIPQE